MKRILLVAGIGALALATPGWVNEAAAKPKGRSAVVSHAASPRFSHSAGHARLNSSRSFSSAQLRSRSYHVTPRLSRATVLHRSNMQRSRIHALAQHRGQTSVTSRARSNVTINRGNNFATNRSRSTRVNNNWRGQRFHGQNYAAFRNYHREWHNRNWWRHNHTRIIFVSGGWYYWDTGYWYPAWGYDPYAYYPYDGPIYGYNDLTPDQVIENVQMQLQRDGYYAGPIDGVLGPMTRQALASFQSDRGLAITSAVDEPTLATLGLT